VNLKPAEEAANAAPAANDAEGGEPEA